MCCFTKPFFLTIAVIIFLTTGLFASKIPTYYMVNGVEGNMSQINEKVKTALTSNSFKILGDYNPANQSDFYVIAFTSDALTNVSLKYKDRGALASVLRAAVRQTGSTIEVSFVNPEYIFSAYFMEGISDQKSNLIAISDKVKSTLKGLGTGLSSFGGELEEEDLQEYQYMWGMPEFTDPVKLKEFSSFEEGLEMIRANLKINKGGAVKVYENTITGSKVAVFGVGFHNDKKGERHFLSIIGEKHIAAMPYEIILQDSMATMLHGRFRIALFWPELTMGTFTKIMGTPGDIEKFLKGLMEN